MSVPVFLELVEMKAKTASVFPFIIGMCFSAFYLHQVNWGLAIIFFVAMFLFNMAVDIMDNYNDYHHAVDTVNYKKKTNIIGRENLNPNLILALLLTFSAIAALLGIYLVYRTGWPLLLMGVFCFLIGIFYSSGPHPLSGLPLGEFFSGFTMGFMIILISVYVNSYQIFAWNWSTLWRLVIIALPDQLWISNLMLANNLCDMQEDENNHRHTIIHYIGIKNGLRAYCTKNVVAFVMIIISPFLGIAPWTVLLTLLIIPFVYQQTKQLVHKQVKNQTFLSGVRTLLVGSACQAVTYLLGIGLSNLMH